MDERSQSLAQASAVYLGATVLVGLPAALLVHRTLIWMVPTSVRIGETTAGSLVLVVVSLAIGLQLATVVAAVNLHGLGVLRRGSKPAVVIRHLAFAGVVLFALAGAIGVGLWAALHETGLLSSVLGIVVAFAAILVGTRGVRAASRGYRSVRE